MTNGWTDVANADVVLVMGGNPAENHPVGFRFVMEARRKRKAKLVVIDPYRTGTALVADMHLALRPGTDAALACAVMHMAFRDGQADRAYMAHYADCPDRLEAHLATRGPEWAAGVTGLSVAEIEAFGTLYNATSRSFIRC